MPGRKRTTTLLLQTTAIASLLIAVTPAHADKASVDWTRGVLFAPGAAAADIHAPSPAIARLKARRQAFGRAKAELKRRARNVPWATGGTVADQLKTAAQIARFNRVIARALPRDVQYASDGSVMLRAAVGLEAIRLAVVGPATPAKPQAFTIITLVVDLGKLAFTPRLGVTLVASGARYAGPTVYHRPTTTTGNGVIRVKATRITADKHIELDASVSAGQLRAARDSGALVVLVLRDPR